MSQALGAEAGIKKNKDSTSYVEVAGGIGSLTSYSTYI